MVIKYSLKASLSLTRSEIFVKNVASWPSSKVVMLRTANPPFVGSIPASASSHCLKGAP